MNKLLAVAAALLVACAGPVGAQTPNSKVAVSDPPVRSTHSNPSGNKVVAGNKFVVVPPAPALVDGNKPSLPTPRQPTVLENPGSTWYGLNGGGG